MTISFTVNSFLLYLRLTVKIFQFLRLSTKFLAVLRLSVNPIETLKEGWRVTFSDGKITLPAGSTFLFLHFMCLLTEWEGRTGKYLTRGLTERTHITQHAFLVSTVRVWEFSLSYGLPTKLRAGPYGSYDKGTLAHPAGSTQSRPDNQSMRERCC